MMLTALLLSAATPIPVQANAEYTGPAMCIQGEPYVVRIRLEAPFGAGTAVPSWMLTPAAFSLNGEPLGARPEGNDLVLQPAQTVETSVDIGPSIQACGAFNANPKFRLVFANGKNEFRDVVYLEAAEKGINFMELPEGQLGDYDVVLRTSRGDIWVELWPDIAPTHTRNFLDLSYTGFYDDNEFHRVIPGFMIQGGRARGRPAPRRLQAEFSSRRHLPGVLSMARYGQDTKDDQGNIISAVNSATCEFFVMHAVSPHLDGQYSAFGKVVTGMDAVEKIVHSAEGQGETPRVRQVIYKAIVVKAPPTKPKDE